MDAPDTEVAIRLTDGVEEIDPALWDACAAPEARDGSRARHPFLTHRFLSALERSGSVSWEEGWGAKPLVAETTGGAPLGVMPLYVKTHSQGEYVFDHGWADAFERAGGQYYPKLVCAAPFTPATGRRLLVHPQAPLPPETVERALIEGASQIAANNRLSSLHLLFCEEGEARRMGAAGLLLRNDQQFHWTNHGYTDFDAFLASLSSRKRKQIRKERAQAQEGVEIVSLSGEAIEREHWDAMWDFYQDTGARKWGHPYLTRAFFDIAHETMRDDVLLLLARRGGRWVAGALNLIGRDTLYGRYWGCAEDRPCLHFELCYYRAMDYAIAAGLGRVEAGAQGAHKLARGYEPTLTWSAHWIANPGLRDAVAHYLTRERAAVAMEREALEARTPFRRESPPAHRAGSGPD